MALIVKLPNAPIVYAVFVQVFSEARSEYLCISAFEHLSDAAYFCSQCGVLTTIEPICKDDFEIHGVKVTPVSPYGGSRY